MIGERAVVACDMGDRFRIEAEMVGVVVETPDTSTGLSVSAGWGGIVPLRTEAEAARAIERGRQETRADGVYRT